MKSVEKISAALIATGLLCSTVTASSEAAPNQQQRLYKQMGRFLFTAEYAHCLANTPFTAPGSSVDSFKMPNSDTGLVVVHSVESPTSGNPSADTLYFAFYPEAVGTGANELHPAPDEPILAESGC